MNAILKTGPVTVPDGRDLLDPLVDACEFEAYPGEVMERRIANGDFNADGKQVVVVNPRGTPPPINLRPMGRPPREPGRKDGLLRGREVHERQELSR